MDRNTANMDINVTPELRFPEFTDKWELKTLGELATKVNRRNRQLQVSRVLTNSATEGVIDQNDYFDRDIAVKENTDNYHIVDAGDFVYNPRISVSAPVGPISVNKIGTGIMSPLYTIFRFRDGYVPFFDQYFQTKIWHPYLKSIANFGARFDRMNITTEGFFNMPIVCPSFAEQKKIAACLEVEDRMISAQEQKVESLKAHKKGLMQHLFPQPGTTTPILRFPGFTGEWLEKPLSHFLHEHKTKSDGKCEVYSVSVTKGVINQVEYLGRSFAASDTSKYNLAKPGDIIYTKSPTGAFPYGIVKQNKNPYNVIVSPLYAVYTPVNQYVGYILDSYFESPVNTNNYLSSLIQKGAKNTIQISNDTFVSKSMCLPSNPAEQQKIAECLESLDSLIAAETKELECLKVHKKGLMQQLFPQPNK